MENLFLSAENILSHLSQNRLTKEDLQTIKLLEKAEKHGCENKSEQYKIIEEVLQMIQRRSVSGYDAVDDDHVFSCVLLLTCLQEQQKLPCLSDDNFANVCQWLLDHYKCKEENVLNACRIMAAVGNMFSLHPENGGKYFMSLLQMILKNISPISTDLVLITTLQCLNKILSILKDSKLADEQCAICSEVGHKLLQLHYSDVSLNINSSNISIAILYTLELLQKIVALDSNFAKLQTAELLGLSKAYFHFGANGSENLLAKPQKVCISQQTLYDSAEEIETVMNSENAKSCGGKTPKTRKPRTVAKTGFSNECKSNNRSPVNKSYAVVYDIKTSDSDISETENASNRILFGRSRNAKIRVASVILVGSIVRMLDRKTLFGYWHALFPSGTADTDNLLYIGQHDPNLRCRAAALQVCAQLLYGSKGYLHQAEINIKRCPTTFIPFSVSLGYTVLAIYKSLTTILSSESSLPVLTQALKCLAVLVQASPFKQFEKGFVQNFIRKVKPLVYHRDAAIQVSALMVMEFLIANPEITSDIAEAIGITQEIAIKRKSKLQHVDDEEIDIDTEEFVDSEEDNSVELSSDESATTELSNTQRVQHTSWLLFRVLHNLGQHDKMLATSVRIESLQVLIAMSSNFAMIKPHLAKVSEVLLYGLSDALPDVRLYAARCVDACAYQINRYLSDNAPCSQADIRECNQFWLHMLPFIMGYIRRNSEEMTTVRVTLCDALSNIGVHIFEYIPHSNQIRLLSFLSGVSSESTEDTIVRAAGARALAVYAVFPSLRSDLVFIENTAELTLLLVKDCNLLVRVKSFWSLGNISDALISKLSEINQSRQERISDDLLFRLITAATVACSDNDKVRCNAVRTLGNLLRLLNETHLNGNNSKFNWLQTFSKSTCKLGDCIRSSGNAKVKWNTCYAITNLMRNPTIFKVSDISWQAQIFSALCHVIVHHSNFKVRINATAAITNIMERTHFGVYYEKFWSSVLEAIEQSYNLDNFHEYNHRDSLQEHLCLSLSHIIRLAINDDLPMLRKHLMPRVDIIRNTWTRVINRMVPEKAAPLLSCPVVLLERGKQQIALSLEQKNSLHFLIEIFSAE